MYPIYSIRYTFEIEIPESLMDWCIVRDAKYQNEDGL